MPLLSRRSYSIPLLHAHPVQVVQALEALMIQLSVRPGTAVRELLFGRRHGGLVGIEEAP